MDQPVATALKAYDDGYRIIAGWFNEAFDARKIGVRIDADPPPPGVTLGDCQRQLSNALLGFRPHCPDMLPDDQLCPWVVGYLLGERDQSGEKVSGIGVRENQLSAYASAEAVENIVGVKHGYGWKDAAPWRAFVVEPMEENAKSWREWLGQSGSASAGEISTCAKASPHTRPVTASAVDQETRAAMRLHFRPSVPGEGQEMAKPLAHVSRILHALVNVKTAMLAFENYGTIDDGEASGFNWRWLKDKVKTALDELAVAEHLNAYVSPSVQREAKAFLEGDIGVAYHLDAGHGTVGPPSREEVDSITSLIVEFQKASDGAASREPSHPPGDRQPGPAMLADDPKLKATVNQRMAGKIMEDSDAMGWNSTQWATHLKCAKSTVVETAAWKKLESARLTAKAEHMKDRRRKPKASDRRRQ